MANSAEHAVAGGAVGLGMYLALCRYYKRQPKLGEALICTGVAIVTAGVPDLIEPALHPHHRQFAHSVTAGGLVTKLALAKCGIENELWDEFQKILAAAAVAGYVSHLVLDGCTPHGLPLLGK